MELNANDYVKTRVDLRRSFTFSGTYTLKLWERMVQLFEEHAKDDCIDLLGLSMAIKSGLQLEIPLGELQAHIDHYGTSKSGSLVLSEFAEIYLCLWAEDNCHTKIRESLCALFGDASDAFEQKQIQICIQMLGLNLTEEEIQLLQDDIQMSSGGSLTIGDAARFFSKWAIRD